MGILIKNGQAIFQSGDVVTGGTTSACCDCVTCTPGCYVTHLFGSFYQYNKIEAYYQAFSFAYTNYILDHPTTITQVQTSFIYPITAYSGAGPLVGTPMGEMVATVNHDVLICPGDLPYSSSVSWLFDAQAEYTASAWGAYPLMVYYSDITVPTTLLTADYDFTTLTIPMAVNTTGTISHLLTISLVADVGSCFLLCQFNIRFQTGACPILEP